MAAVIPVGKRHYHPGLIPMNGLQASIHDFLMQVFFEAVVIAID